MKGNEAVAEAQTGRRRRVDRRQKRVGYGQSGRTEHDALRVNRAMHEADSALHAGPHT
jgi:hypothetical protein